jgi:tRNA (guanine37-N1)-methyltransferase
MQVAVVTLFPELMQAFLATSLIGRAISQGTLSVVVEPLREHGLGRHLSVDDAPYGGGSGMVLRVDCVVSAIEAAERRLAAGVRPTRVLLTPQGRRFDQAMARELAAVHSFILVCGRYEGFDERVRGFVDRELSLGDFVLGGGEVAAMAVIEACARLVPGVLGNEASSREESFGEEPGLLEYPQYTRPAEFRGHGVPEVLKSGDHPRIRAWRREQARIRTRERRPDLLERSSPRRGPAEPE